MRPPYRVPPVLLAVAALASCATPIPPLPPGADATAQPSRTPDIYYEPMPAAVVTALLRLAEVKPGDLVYDLGSGDGRVPIAAVIQFGARGVGIEIQPRLVAVARANAARAGVADRATFRTEDIFEADFRDATVVALFLFPHVNRRLRPKLLAELKPGTRVVSYYHDMDDWQPESVVKVRGAPIYLWRIPEKADQSRPR